jgi:hypothetical protein
VRNTLDHLPRGHAESRGGARREILHDDVGPLDETAEYPGAALGLQIDRERLLVAVRPDEMRCLAERGRIVGAGEVAAPHVLDLDDAGAEITEAAGAVGR